MLRYVFVSIKINCSQSQIVNTLLSMYFIRCKFFLKKICFCVCIRVWVVNILFLSTEQCVILYILCYLCPRQSSSPDKFFGTSDTTFLQESTSCKGLVSFENLDFSIRRILNIQNCHFVVC